MQHRLEQAIDFDLACGMVIVSVLNILKSGVLEFRN